MSLCSEEEIQPHTKFPEGVPNSDRDDRGLNLFHIYH